MDRPDGELEQARQEIERLRRENEDLRKRLGMPAGDGAASYPTKPVNPLTVAQPLPLSFGAGKGVTEQSTIQEKVRLFRSLFRGREDVYAAFWANERTGKKGYAPACEDPWAGRSSAPRKYLPLTDEVVRAHLEGVKTIGVYPLLQDSSCWFLACDFDKQSWALDAVAFLECCARFRIPACLERSRSGNGGHVWIFFSSPVPATQARQLGTRLLSQAMAIRGDMDLASYDRFFPSQDFVPKGGFGNLIALPLQKARRALGNTEFLNTGDAQFPPWPDQWAFLSRVERATAAQVEEWLDRIPPVTVGLEAARAAMSPAPGSPPAPPEIRGFLGAGVSFEKSGIPAWLLSRIKHMASLHNPVFYERQKLRFSTYRIPRFIKCYDEDFAHLHLPRGVKDELERIIKEAGSRLSITDRRPKASPLSLEFHGSLLPAQERALKAVLAHDIGVLVAPPAAGKTVIGCCAVARRNVPALILAHRKPILDQWRKHLMSLLGLPSARIGQVGGGRNRQSGTVDLGMLQTLKRIPDLPTFFSDYGFVVIDECHHVPAATFEACVKQAPVRYILGLTATPYRRDGLQALITMQCGPVRHTMRDDDAGPPPILYARNTEFVFPASEEAGIQDIFAALVKDSDRNSLIEKDIRKALSEGRQCLILSDRKDHCREVAGRIAGEGCTPFVLDGSLGKKEREGILKGIREAPSGKGIAIIATGQYLGEGFDCPQVDAIFLAFPLSFRGKLVQYVGRVLRASPGKPRPRIYDYADGRVSMLKAMAAKRMKAYKSLGIEIADDGQATLFNQPSGNPPAGT